jgi:hypothetical protein
VDGDMPDITLTFEDGKQHIYQNAPDALKPEDVYARASKDFPNAKIKAISRASAKQEPVYDPMGNVTGYNQPSLPSSKEALEFEQKEGPLGYAKEYGKGAIAGIAGLPGEAINLPATIAGMSGVNIPRIPIGVPEISKYFWGEPKSNVAAGMRSVGEILGVPGIPFEIVAGANLAKALGAAGQAVSVPFKASSKIITKALGRPATEAETALIKKAQEAATSQVDILSAAEKEKIAALEAEATKKATAEKAAGRAERAEKLAGRGLAGTKVEEEFGQFGVVPQTKQALGEEVRTGVKNFVEPVKKVRNEKANSEIAASLQSAKAKEAVAPFKDSGPMKEVKDFIEQKLKVETDESLRRQLETVKRSLFEGADGVSPSFESSETIRRKIGDAAFNVPEEGYAAIGQNLARDLYFRISGAMKAYEPSFGAYLDRYERLSETIKAAGSKIGKAVLGTEPGLPSYHSVPADKIVDRVFSSPDNVKTLIEAYGGNKQPVAAIAERYFANQLAGKTADEARKILTSDKSRSLFAELGPDFRKKIEDKFFAQAAEQSKRVSAATQAAKDAETKISEISKTLEPVRKQSKEVQEGMARIETATTSERKREAAESVIASLKKQLPPDQFEDLRRSVDAYVKASEEREKARSTLMKAGKWIGLPVGASIGAYETKKLIGD